MNVYDFDNTIYRGESALDFFFFLLWRNFRIAKYIPLVLYTTVKYKLCLTTVDGLFKTLDKYVCELLELVGDVDEVVKKFWDKNEHKIKKFYLEQKRDDDIIISAGVNFLLEEMLARLGIKNYLCTEIDKKTGEIISFCYNRNKVSLFEHKFSDVEIEAFYTDSLNDLPMIRKAKSAYLVKYKMIKKIK